MAIQRVNGLSVFIFLCIAKSLPFSDFRAFRYQIVVSLSPSLVNARGGANCRSKCSRRLDWPRYGTAGDRDFVAVAPKPVSLCRSHRSRLQVVVRELARE